MPHNFQMEGRTCTQSPEQLYIGVINGEDEEGRVTPRIGVADPSAIPTHILTFSINFGA